MKLYLRLTALLLTVALLLLSAGCNDSSQSEVVTSEAQESATSLSFTPLAAGDEEQLYNNPDRGFRTEMVYTVYDKHPDPENEGKYTSSCDLINPDGYINRSSKCYGKHDVRNIYANLSKAEISEVIEYIFRIYFPDRAECQSKLALVFVGFPDYNKCDLPERCLTAIKMLLERFRKQEAKVLWRHDYNPPWLDWTISEENKKKLEEECADQKTMFRHIDQLAPIFSEYKDVIHKFSSGFIGNGEFTENWQYPVIDTNALIKKVLETWCIPNDVYYTVRLAKFKIRLEEAEPDYKYLNLIGYNNDAIFGEQTNPGWHSGCFQKNHSGSMNQSGCDSTHEANSWWDYVIEHAAYTPQSGEMFVNSNHLSTNRVPTGMEVILELAHHRYTSFSQWHCYLEVTDGSGVIQGWIDNEVVTPELLDRESVLYDPDWFKDSDGNEVVRNPYEFIRDHLGYKIVAQNMTLTGNIEKGNTLKAELMLKNYGFAAAFNMSSGLAVLDENYNLVSEVSAGNPEEWYSHDPNDHMDTNALEHTVSAEIELPDKKGKYHIAFYLKNNGDQSAKLSNEMSYENGYNILFSFEI